MADFLQHAPPDDREGVSGAVSAQFPLARADKGENRFLSAVSFNRACVRPMPSVLDGGEKDIAKSPSATITIKIDVTTPLHVRGGPALLLGLSTQESMNPPITVGGQNGDERLDRGEKRSIRQRRATSTTRGGPLPGREVRARDAQGCGDRAHRPPPGHEVTREGSFLGAVTRSTASRRISFSSVFLPSNRCSSRICW